MDKTRNGYIRGPALRENTRGKTEVAVADRGVSGPWGPQFCGGLCKGVTQRFISWSVGGGGAGRCKPHNGVQD